MRQIAATTYGWSADMRFTVIQYNFSFLRSNGERSRTLLYWVLVCLELVLLCMCVCVCVCVFA